MDKAQTLHCHLFDRTHLSQSPRQTRPDIVQPGRCPENCETLHWWRKEATQVKLTDYSGPLRANIRLEDFSKEALIRLIRLYSSA